MLPQARNFHGKFQDPNTYVQVPLQVAAEREIARSYFASIPGRQLAAADWDVSYSSFAHPPVRCLPCWCCSSGGGSAAAAGCRLLWLPEEPCQVSIAALQSFRMQTLET